MFPPTNESNVPRNFERTLGHGTQYSIHRYIVNKCETASGDEHEEIVGHLSNTAPTSRRADGTVSKYLSCMHSLIGIISFA